MTLLQINFSCRSIMNRSWKLLRYVNEISNAFIGRISQAEPKKLASVVKPKTSPAVGIAVVNWLCRWSFKAQKGHRDRIQHIGQTFIWRSGTYDPFSNPSYSSRVCAKCALKIWHAVELVRFLKAIFKTRRSRCWSNFRWLRDSTTLEAGKSKSSTPGEKPKSAKTPTAEQQLTSFCSAFE